MQTAFATLALLLGGASCVLAQDVVAPTWMREAEGTRSHAAQALVRAGRHIMLRAPVGLVSYAADGRVRWRYEPVRTCGLPGVSGCLPRIVADVATPDGGAWVLLATTPLTRYYDADQLQRIAPDGRVTEHPLPSLTHFTGSRHLLLADDDAATLLWTNEYAHWGSIGIYRRSASGVESHGAIRLAEYAFMGVRAATRLPDGDLVVVYQPDLCPELCLPDGHYGLSEASVVRASPRGDVRWQTTSQVLDIQQVEVSSSGTAWISGGEALRAQSVDADGVSSTVAELPYSNYRYHLIGAADDRALLLFGDGALLLDRYGDTGLTAHWGVHTVGDSAPSPEGFFVAVHLQTGDDFLMLDRATLAVRWRARYGLPAPLSFSDPVFHQSTLSHDEGTYFAVRTMRWADGIDRTHLARFDAPGSVAESRILRDSFEP